MFLLEEELAFTKLNPLIALQKNNGARITSNNKVNHVACGEFAEIIAEVVHDFVKDLIEKSNFATISGDASEARKTSEEKELVFSRLIASGCHGVVPVTVLLKCQRLKDFGGGTSDGTFTAMNGAMESYVSSEKFISKLVCAVADGASVNFGKHSGALTQLCQLTAWDIPRIHCMNHKLELAMKDSYTNNKTFSEIKDMLDVLFRMFRNSGRTWRIYQLVAEKLSLVPLRFTKVGGTQFQAHTLNALSSFIRNFVISAFFVENVEEQGSGKDSLVTKEMYPKIVGYQKKWLKLEFLASANMFYRILNETGHLSLIMESDTALIYQLCDVVKETISNLQDIADEEDTCLLPDNIKIIKETRQSENFLMADTVTVAATASNVSNKKLEQLRLTIGNTDDDQIVTVVKENFVLNKAEAGKIPKFFIFCYITCTQLAHDV